MRSIDTSRLETLVDELGRPFYALMCVSLLAILVGSLGSGALLLILGASVQVVRASCESFAARRRNRARRVRPAVVRSARDRAVPRTAHPRRSARPVAASASRR
jgi:hypothetical protein